MAEEAELEARIAAINEKINQHKQQAQQMQHQQQQQERPQNHLPFSNSYSPRGRWSPYPRGGRGGGFQQPSYRNRTLLVAGAQSSPPRPPSAHGGAPNATTVSAEPYVTTQSPGRMQLMNKDTYERERKQLLQQKHQAREAKKQQIDRKERTTLEHHMVTLPASSNRVLIVDGVQFQLRDDGNKLIRIQDANTAAKEVPRKVKIAGVDFFRTKNGNLVRTNAIRTLLRPTHRSKKQCENFTKHGICAFGPNCNFAHDPDQVAICKTFLHTGSCAAGDSCNLSHVLSYHRVPACTHFLRGNCTKEACPFPHIRVSQSAPVCRPFALLGYCSAGEDCEKRHVFECPDYSNTGFCANRENGKCFLSHPDYASALRKAAAKQARTGSEDDADVSSDEEMHRDDAGFDDIDSDEAEDVIMGGDVDHALSQQQDFIAFS